jgi:hypothetical protein
MPSLVGLQPNGHVPSWTVGWTADSGDPYDYGYGADQDDGGFTYTPDDPSRAPDPQTIIAIFDAENPDVLILCQLEN